MKTENKSLHLVGTIKTTKTDTLTNMFACVKNTEDVLLKNDVQVLGNVSHTFENEGGYTIVFCIAESHLAVHTWPEFNKVTLDVFLCNYLRDNTDRCKAIFEAVVSYFEPEEIERQELLRE